MFRVNMDNIYSLTSNSYVVDHHGTLIECNEAQAKSAGVEKPSDLIGMNCYYEIGDKEAGEIIKKNNQKILRTQQPSIVVEKITIDNQVHCYLSYKKPILNSNTQSDCLIGLSIQLDPEKELDSKFYEINRCNRATYQLIANTACNSPSMTIEGKSVTKFERDCLYYLICGLTPKRIAYYSKMSHRTVEFYISRMQEKFNCDSIIALIVKTISSS